MNEESRLDLSALDARNEPARWEALINATLARVDVVLAQRSPDPLTLIATWTKALTAGAVVMLAVLIPVEIGLEAREASAVQVERLVHLSAETIRSEQQPTGAELFRALATGETP